MSPSYLSPYWSYTVGFYPHPPCFHALVLRLAQKSAIYEFVVCLIHQYTYCCRANVASKQQHNWDLRRVYRRRYKFSNSSLFIRVHCATFYHSASRHKLHKEVTPSFRIDSSEKGSGYVLLWFTCKMMWRRLHFTFTTLAVSEIWMLNCDILI